MFVPSFLQTAVNQMINLNSKLYNTPVGIQYLKHGNMLTTQ
jgi:hypothetical protein